MSTLENIRDALADLTRQDFPTLDVPPGPHSYKVVAVRGDGRCDLRAVKKGPPAEIPNVDHWSASGAGSKPQVGSIVVVSFLDGDPGSPMIGAYQPLRVAGGVPTLSTLDGTIVRVGPSATLVEFAKGPLDIAYPVGRVGDKVTLAAINIIAPPGGGPCSVNTTAGTITLEGTITEGSSKVTSA